jgi:hypothetical protein
MLCLIAELKLFRLKSKSMKKVQFVLRELKVNDENRKDARADPDPNTWSEPRS